MVKTIKGVSIQGKCFETRTKLSLFKDESNKTDRLSIIYGKNGSGKSVIGLAFSAIADVQSGKNQTVQTVVAQKTDVTSRGITASLIDYNGDSIQLQYNNKSIHVFNESYIDRNIRVQTDGLGSIVMLGEQVDLQDEINDYTMREKNAKKAVDEQKTLCDRYNLNSDSISPKYYWEAIKNVLRKPGGWSEEDSQLRSLKQNSPVTDQVVRDICTMVPKKTYIISELMRKLSEKEATLNKIRDTTDSFPNCIKTISYGEEEEKIVRSILSNRITEPVLTNREKTILEVIQAGHQSQIESAQTAFTKSDTTFCPFCFQTIDNDYKTGLLESIRKVLNKDVDKHKIELAAIVFPTIRCDYSEFRALDANLVVSIQNATKECNMRIESYKKKIEEKNANIYIPITDVNFDLVLSIKDLNSLLESLEAKRLSFIESKEIKGRILDEAVSLNRLIAHEAVQELYKEYLMRVTEKKKADEDYATLKKTHEDIQTHLKELLDRKANTQLAVNKINSALQYIFFKKERLEIEQRDGQYYLKTNGHDVRPCDISLGERNAIALCYFFIEMFADKEVEKMYKDELFVVIDDPISSFDIENRVGVISYLRYKMARIIKGNSNSRVIILTHDITTEFDLIKAATEICKPMADTKFSKWELLNCELKSFTKNRSEYKELLKAVYKYANGVNETDGTNIGNMMRRALEAFATFVYQKNSYEVSCDPAVLEVLDDKSKYFENLMCRLVLNGESHFEEQVYSLRDDGQLINYMSDDEKARTAKDILSFMYLLNKQHVEAYLKDVAGATAKIQIWSNAIPINEMA